MLAEYAAMIAVSSIAVTLWLGGWMRPFPNLLQHRRGSSSSLCSGTDFRRAGGDCFIGTARYAGAIVL